MTFYFEFAVLSAVKSQKNPRQKKLFGELTCDLKTLALKNKFLRIRHDNNPNKNDRSELTNGI